MGSFTLSLPSFSISLAFIAVVSFRSCPECPPGPVTTLSARWASEIHYLFAKSWMSIVGA